MKTYNSKLNIEEIPNIPSPLSLKFMEIEKKVLDNTSIPMRSTNKTFEIKTSSCASCENISDSKCECE